VRTMKAALVAAVTIATAFAAGGSLLATNAAGHEDLRTRVPALHWVDCGDGLQCTTAKVPLDYDRPDGRRISLALARVPAGDPAQRVGSLFVNNGGPGNAVLDFVRNDARNVLSADIQARFDIVGFDPRGVGESTPVRCFADAESQEQFFGSLAPFPVTKPEIEQAADAAKILGRRCRRHNGELLDHLSTANVARDMDLLRQAVGDQQLTFAGYSYGGLLGTTYAQLFPTKVRALLLDGAPDPVAWATGLQADRRQPFSRRVGGATATSDAMGFFLDSCQEAGDACAFASQDTRAKFDELLARLLVAGSITVDLPAGPIGPGGPTTITYAFVVDGLRGGLQFPPIWADLAELLQATFEATDAAAPRTVNPATDPGPEATSDIARAPTADEVYDNSREALFAVACSETDNPSAMSRWTKEAAAADRETPYFGADWTWLSLPCATWPARDRDRSTGPFDPPTENPMLFVNSRFDAASPYERAVEVAGHVPNARLLTVEGAGHPASFIPNGCLSDAVDRYLIELRPPAPGAVCKPDFVPFS
jgi:pimeloyl-ACP methyl ester carboxylesterase